MFSGDKSNQLVVIGNFDSVRQRRRLEVNQNDSSVACDLFVGELRLSTLYFKQIAISAQHFVDGAMFLELGPERLLELVGRQSSSLTRELPIAVYSPAKNYTDALRKFVDRDNKENPGHLYPMEFATIKRGHVDRREFAKWLGQQKAASVTWDNPVATIHGLIVKFAISAGIEQAGRQEADRICAEWQNWIDHEHLFDWQVVEALPQIKSKLIDEVEYQKTLGLLSKEAKDCLVALRSEIELIGRSQQRAHVRDALSGRTKKLDDEVDIINDWYDSLAHRVFASYAKTSYKEIVEDQFFEGEAADARLERAGWKSKITDGFLPIKLQNGWLRTLAVMPASKFEDLKFDLREAQQSWWLNNRETDRQRITLALNQAIALESFSRKRWAILAKLLFAAIAVVLSFLADLEVIDLPWVAAGVGAALLAPDIAEVTKVLPWILGSLVTSGQKRRLISRQR